MTIKIIMLKSICWAQRLFTLIIFSLFIVSMLSACGNKGNLYLPENSSKNNLENNLENNLQKNLENDSKDNSKTDKAKKKS